MKKKKLTLIVLAVVLLLLIPLIAMQFTNEVNWNLADFMVAGFLLLSTGLIAERVLRKIDNIKYQIALTLAMLTVFLLIWAELAVGILGTPLAGT